MIQNNLVVRRLIWKEIQQLKPLVLVLLVASLLCHLLVSLSKPAAGIVHPTADAHQWILLGMPGLFAVGVGALLIGQEKEQRTLLWLKSLPVPPRQIIMTKLSVSLVALVLIWLISVLILLLFVSRIRLSEDPVVILTWISHTLFILLAGMALAWKINSSFASLLCLVPIAFVPYAISWGITVFIEQPYYFRADARPSLLLAWQAILSLVAASLVWRFGKQSLGAAKVVSGSIDARTQVQAIQQRTILWRLSSPILTPFSALTWQMWAQSRWFLCALLGMACLGACFNIFSNPLGVAAVMLASVWLGVVSFQGDRLHNRIRFLADRGVRPRRVWWTRQIVPIVMLGIVALWACGIHGFQNVNKFEVTAVTFATIAGLFLMALMAYSHAQWVSQITFSPIVAAVVAPMAAAGAGLYHSYVGPSLLLAPIWILALCTPIPFIATYGAMQRWMEGRFGFSYWAWHSSLLLAWLCIPAMPLVFAMLTVESMPAEIAREIKAERSSAFTPSFYGQELELLPGIRSSAAGSAQQLETSEEQSTATKRLEPSVSLLEQWPKIAAHIDQQLTQSSIPVRNGNRAVNHMVATMRLLRMKLDAEEQSANQDDVIQYRQCIGLLTRAVERIRTSNDFKDQSYADWVESALTRELAWPNARQRLAETYVDAARQLSNSVARNAARRQAIAQMWISSQVSFDAFTQKFSYHLSRAIGNPAVVQRQFGRAVADLWELAGTGGQGATPERVKKIADFWGHAPPTGAAIGSQEAEPTLLQRPPVGNPFPFASWFAPWERQAAKLLVNE